MNGSSLKSLETIARFYRKACHLTKTVMLSFDEKHIDDLEIMLVRRDKIFGEIDRITRQLLNQYQNRIPATETGREINALITEIMVYDTRLSDKLQNAMRENAHLIESLQKSKAGLLAYRSYQSQPSRLDCAV